MRAELYASAAVHIALLFWLAFGERLFQARVDEEFQVTGVTIISNAEFDALLTPAVIAPPQMPAPVPEQEPTPEPEPEQDAAPEPAPEPTPAPEPEPDPEPAPEPDPIEAPALPSDLGALDAPLSDTPTPEQAPRVAPTPAPAPEPDVETAPEVTPQPSQDAPSDVTEQVEEEAAPEEATTQIVTEADTPSSAPQASLRPTARPNRPEPQPDAVPETDTAEAAEAESDPLADAIADAVADANDTPPAPAPAPAAAGPPLTAGQIDGFQLAVEGCFNTGALSTEALEAEVVIGFSLNPDGTPDIGTFRQVQILAGTEGGARTLYEAGRRAVINCGRSGYNLPEESYERWREVEAVFRPSGISLR